MENTNTSSERVDALENLSDRVYEAIDQKTNGTHRYRRIVRLGMNATANTLQEKNMDDAGDTYLSMLHEQLQRGGVTPFDYQEWKQYKRYAESLSKAPDVRTTRFDDLAKIYADTTRGTADAERMPESDARHAVHLGALAVPYAMKYYPDLNYRKTAVYALWHDVLEAYTGDVQTLGISQTLLDEKHRLEAEALVTFGQQYRKEWPQLVTMLERYEALDDDEAKFTKSFDKLDPGFTHYANHGAQLLHHYGYGTKEAFISDIETGTSRIRSYGSSFPFLLEDRDELTKRIADHTEWPATDQLAS
jgi:5'-deoxynucleotidase YfbR-like HD superfamily hydrolase